MIQREGDIAFSGGNTANDAVGILVTTALGRTTDLGRDLQTRRGSMPLGDALLTFK